MRLPIRLLALLILAAIFVSTACSNKKKKGSTVLDGSDVPLDGADSSIGPLTCEINVDCLGLEGQDACSKAKCDQSVGQCVLWTVPNCCVNSDECDDGLENTNDFCDSELGICKHQNMEILCQTELDCPALEQPCMSVECDGYCTSWKKPDCCVDGSDCDDGDDCTVDQCDAFECRSEANDIPICCGDTVTQFGFSDGTLGEATIETNGEPVVWHGSTARTHSPGGAARFADPETGTYSNPKVDGLTPASQGALVLPAQALPANTDALSLSFWLWLDIETGPLFDLFTVEARTGDETSGMVVWTKEELPVENYKTWTLVTVDISALRGETVAFAFVVDTLDGTMNQGEGVTIDDILIRTGCGDPVACTSDDECAVDTPCMTGQCLSGICSEVSIDDCCVTDEDCPAPPASCGTLVGCQDNACVYDLEPPCCVTDSDCADDQQNVCGTCTTIGMCSYTEKIECCLDDECEDENPCTTNVCQANSTCRFDDIPDCTVDCGANDECTDNDACTVDTCEEGSCVFVSVNCDDDNACTVDSCADGQCENVAIECVDDDPCTDDICVDGGCVHLTDPTCVPPCTANSECADGDPCTDDVCNADGSCSHPQIPGCVNQCEASSDCDDNDDCTTNVCLSGECTFLPIVGCGGECTTAADCDDGNPCSIDQCVDGACNHSADPNCSVCETGPVYAQGFDIPAASTGWTLSGPIKGVGWHIGTFGQSTSPTGALYYGNPQTMNYENGLPNSGTATSPPLVIAPTAGGAMLSFMVRADVEPMPDYDVIEVRALVAGSNDSETVWTKAALPGGGGPMWSFVQVDMSAFAGQSIQLQFFFDTTDPIENETSGVFVDDVLVSQNCEVQECQSVLDCDDGDECTSDLCTDGTCSHFPVPGCGAECEDDEDCMQGSFCTFKTCEEGQCVLLFVVPDCCDTTAECNDSDECTEDQCLGNQCVFTDIPGCGTSSCTNNQDCDDGDPCTQFQCIAGQCLGQEIVGCCSNDSQCDDGDVCTFDACFEGACAHVTLPGCGPACNNDAECQDSDPCTASICLEGSCASQQVLGCCNTASECDDFNVCTTNVCAQNECVFDAIDGCCATALDCNDNNPCTTDACQGGKCSWTPNDDCCVLDSQCDDGNVCTTDTCSNGTCSSSPIANCCTSSTQCDDGNGCTVNVCSGNQCLFPPIPGCCTSNSDCDDGNPCTSGSCGSNGECVTSAVPGCCVANSECDDGDPCTQDSCLGNQCSSSAISGCCTSSTECDDGNVCTVDVCSNNQCQSQPSDNCCTNDNQCADDDPCTIDSCNTTNGQCTNTPNPSCCSSNADCDDGNGCTVNACDNNGTCTTTNNTAACDDGLHCNGTDSCGGGSCSVHSGDPCASNLGDADFDCTESCNEASDSCTSADPSGSLCSDGLECTVGDACNFAGTCVPGTSPCDGPDGDGDCSETCNDVTGGCDTPDPNGTACADDGNPCTIEACNAGECVSTLIANCCVNDGQCDDGNPCTADDCGANNQCSNTPTANCCTSDTDCEDGNSCTATACTGGTCTTTNLSGACDDGLHCNGTDSCVNGACSNHSGDPCGDVGDDDFDCTESCNENTDSCTAADPSGSPCSDGSACTVNDACNFAGTCIPGSSPCDGPDGDGNCTESCNDLTGDCSSPDPNGSACADDGNPCTIDACNAGQCVSTLIPNCCANDGQCDDGDPCTDDVCQANQCTNTPSPNCCEPQSVLASNFDAGAGGWTTTGSTESKWQLSTTNAQSAPNSFWFGNADTGNFSCDEGLCSGVLSSPPIAFPSGEQLLLQFSAYVDVEQDANWDKLELRIMSGTTGGTVLWDKSVLQPQDYGVWRTYNVDLSAYNGQTLTLRWSFDTGDGVNNGGEGVFIDDVTVDTSCDSLADICVFNSECVDSDPCTDNVCVSGKCQFIENPNCCKSNAECDDNYVCTVDTCADGACQHVETPGCCQFNGECNDDNACTADACTNNQCVNTPTGGAGCCATSVDCDDGDPCTKDTCNAFQCAYESATGPGCCVPGVLLEENFDDATPGEFTLIDDDSGALWSPQNKQFFSPPFSLYYGVPGQWTYNTGSGNGGTAISAAITIPLAANTVTLTFAKWADIPGFGFGNDAFTVKVLAGSTLKTVWTNSSDSNETWSVESVELAEYKGQTIQLYFETAMPGFGNGEGVYVDSINLSNTCSGTPGNINP